MLVQQTVPPIRDRRRGRAVASYTDARGAVLAVATLRRHGFAPETVAVQPGQMSLRPRVLHRPRTAPDWLVPSVAALCAFGAVVAAIDGVLGAALLAAMGAFVAATIARLVDLAVRRWSERRFSRVAGTVAAERFDVVVTARDDEAEHVLASWSNPEATPVRAEGRVS